MPLILVIESDRRQTSKLTILARNQLHADLVIVDNVDQALDKLEECDPDLILTSQLLSGRDQLALGDRLLELEEDGLRIQTLTMPTLGLAGQRARIPQKGAPGRAPIARGRTSQTDSMDPVVFGMQIARHLESVASERAASTTVVRRRNAVILPDEEPEAIEEAPAVESPRPLDTPRSSQGPDWGELLEAMRREIEVARSSSSPERDNSALQDMNLDEFARIINSASYGPSDRGELATSPAVETHASESHVAAIEPTPPDAVPAPPAASEPPARKTKKMRRVPPQDEFGFFDPRQCGLSALYAKLDTISPPAKVVTPKKPS